MARSQRGAGRSTPSLIIPFALTLTTAALASAGLYFFGDTSATSTSYPGSDSEHESAGCRPSYQRRRDRKRADRVHDHITEEDTDAIEESRREEEERILKRRSRRGGGAGGVGIFAAAGSYVKGAAAGAMERLQESSHHDGEEYVGIGDEDESEEQMNPRVVKRDAGAYGELPVPVPQSISASSTTGAVKKGQYIPPPRPKKPIVIVISERKATQGHDSDGDFEEALLPSGSLLSQLPRPLKLANTSLYILIHSPHLTSHPLSHPAVVAASTDSLTLQDPSPLPSPTLQPHRSLHEDANKSSYELALSLLPPDTPREQIMPFTVPESLVPMLRQLAPEVVYFEEAVVDLEGRMVEEVLSGGWVGCVVVVVGGGDADYLAGLISSDDDDAVERRRGAGKWWSEGGDVRKRHGKRVSVVEKWALEDDWRRRAEED